MSKGAGPVEDFKLNVTFHIGHCQLSTCYLVEDPLEYLHLISVRHLLLYGLHDRIYCDVLFVLSMSL